MRAISMDLRMRVARVLEQASSYELGDRFSVSASWVRKLRLRKRAGESLEPRESGHRARKVDAAGEEMLRRWLADEADATVFELCDRYVGERGVVVSETTMRDTLNRMGLSRKKRRSSRPSAKASVSLLPAMRTSRGATNGRVDG